MLSLVGVRKEHWRGMRPLAVLDDVSIDVEAGEWVCVLGQHGSGKTTLLNVACGVVGVDRGRVICQGRDLAALRRRELVRLWRTDVARAWDAQMPAVPHERVRDHVALPLLSRGMRRRQAGRLAAAMLERVGVDALAEASLCELADGERIRVAIAQACVREPQLLLADALTDTLDVVECHAVLGLLRSFVADGMTIVMTAAGVQAARGCDRLLRLSGGRLAEAERAAPADVIAFPRPYAPRTGNAR